ASWDQVKRAMAGYGVIIQQQAASGPLGLSPPTRPAYIAWPLMVFSSPIFLFAFLPFALAAYFGTFRALRNVVLLATSLAFFMWGEPQYAWVLPASLVANFAAGLAIARTDSPRGRKAWLIAAVVANLGLLVAFK